MKSLFKSTLLSALIFSTHAGACINFGPGPWDKDPDVTEDVRFGPGPMDQAPQSEGQTQLGTGPQDDDEGNDGTHSGSGPDA